MNNLQLLTLLTLFISIGCQSSEKVPESNTRNCNCPMENLPDEQSISDSTYHKSNGDDLFDWSLGGKISANIKKIVDAEVDGNIKSNEDTYQISTRKILEKINNNHPELITKAYSFKVGKVFYCAFYTILCQDTTLSDQELRILSSNKLEEFRKDFLIYTQPLKNKKVNTGIIQPQIKTEVKGDGNNTFIGDVTSNNQQGGITAHQVIIHNKPEKRSVGKSLLSIRKALENLPIAAYRIDYSSDDEEVVELYNDINNVLKSLNWKEVGPMIRMAGPHRPKGITISVLKEEEPMITLANQLWRALGNKGVKVEIVQYLDNIFEYWDSQPVKLPVGRSGVVITIGPNPED